MNLLRLQALAAITLAVGTGFQSSGQTNFTAASRTQVVIVGTLHGTHKTSTNYSLEVLRGIIVAMKPAAILIEQPPDRDGQPTVRDGRATNHGGSVESTVANLAADELEVEVIPYDREGRDEYYQRTRYFARQQSSGSRFSQWIEAQARQKPGPAPVLADRLLGECCNRQERISKEGPEVISSPAYDMLIVTKHSLLFGFKARLLLAAGEKELAEEFLFFENEWRERNQIMAQHVREAAARFAGKRLVVLAGAEHRYILRELLSAMREIELKEFYEVPEWTGAKPPTFVGAPPQKNGADSTPPAQPVYTLVGIGTELQNGYPEVKRLFPGSPAELSDKIHPGDRVIAIAQGDHAFVDARGFSMPELVQCIRGKAGTTVRLQVLAADAPPGTLPRTVIITRAAYQVKS